MRKYLSKFINILQKHTAIDIKFYLKGGILTWIGYFVDIIGGLAISMAFARFVSRETYGQLRFFQSFIAIVGIFAMTGMTTATIRAISKGNDGVLIQVIKYTLRWSLLGSALLASTGLYFMFSKNAQPNYYLIFLGLAIIFPFYSVCGYYSVLLFAKKRLLQLTIFNIINRVAYTGVAFLLIYFFPQLATIVIGTYVIDIVIRGLLTIYSIKFIQNNKTDNETIEYGKQLTKLKIFQIIADQIDSILIITFIGPASLAIYGFAILVPQQIRTLAIRIIDLTATKFPTWETSIRTTFFIKRYVKYLFLVSIMLMTLYVFFAPIIFKILFPKYLDAVPFSQIAILTLISIPYSLLGSWFTAQKKHKILVRLYTFSGLTKIILNIILIPIFGIWGAIFAESLNYFSSFIIGYFFFIQESRNKTI
jgi:O-antigen/teichoic acid export membrane protein